MGKEGHSTTASQPVIALKTDFHHLHSVPSTNSWAKACASTFDPKALTIVTADEQTAGRGRSNRPWISPPNTCLIASFCFFVKQDRRDLANIAQVFGVAIAKATAAWCPLIQLKWPNDLVIHKKKLGGILCETQPHGRHTFVVVGVGINVNQDENFLSRINQPAASLKSATGHAIDLHNYTQTIIEACREAIQTYLLEGFSPFIETYRQLLAHQRGDTIRFHHGTKVIQGSFYEISDEGQLQLIVDDSKQSFLSGEIVTT